MRHSILIMLFVVLLALIPSHQQSAFAQQVNACIDRFSSAATVRTDLAAVETQSELRWSGRSPSCRYLVGVFRTPENPNRQRLYIVWDAEAGKRVIETVQPYVNSLLPNIRWHPSESEVLIAGLVNAAAETGNGPHRLYKLNSGERYELTCPRDCAQDLFRSIFWDDQRNWLWVGGRLGVVAYDRNNGFVARTFRNPTWGSVNSQYQGHGWRFSSDGLMVTIFTTENSGYSDSLTIYDIARFAAYDINVQGFIPTAIRTQPECDGLTTFGLTTDNRYLVMGYTALRVWDLHNLPPIFEDRLPDYRHGGPAANIRCLRVISETVIETITIDGASRWNVETGQRVG